MGRAGVITEKRWRLIVVGGHTRNIVDALACQVAERKAVGTAKGRRKLSEPLEALVHRILEGAPGVNF